MIAESGWLTSCAIEAASCPSVVTRAMCVSSACDWASLACARLRSVRSRAITSTCFQPPWSGGRVTRSTTSTISPDAVLNRTSSSTATAPPISDEKIRAMPA